MTYQELLGHRLLSAPEERHLIDKAQNGCETSRERLILLNMRLVHWMCAKYETQTVSAEELIGDGVRGLMRAIDKMDTTRRTRFSTYATYWIHSFVGISPLLQSTLRLPIEKVKAVEKVKRATAALHAQGTHAPSNTQIADLIEDFTPETVAELRCLIETTSPIVSLDAPLNNIEGAEMDWLEVIGYDDPGYEALIHEMDVDFFLSKLPPHEAFILSRSYGIPIEMTNREIADAVGCHRNVVPDIRDRALRKCQRIATFLKDRPLRRGDENWAAILADPIEAPQMEMLF